MEWLTGQLFDLLLVFFIFLVMLVFVMLIGRGNKERVGAAVSFSVAILIFYLIVKFFN